MSEILETLFEKDTIEYGGEKKEFSYVKNKDWKDRSLGLMDLIQDAGLLNKDFKWKDQTAKFKKEFLDAILAISRRDLDDEIFMFNVEVASTIYKCFKYVWYMQKSESEIPVNIFCCWIIDVRKHSKKVKAMYNDNKWNLCMYYIEEHYRDIIRRLDKYIACSCDDEKSDRFLNFIAANHLACFQGFQNFNWNLNDNILDFFKYYGGGTEYIDSLCKSKEIQSIIDQS